MKVTKEHLEILRSAIIPHDTETTRDEYSNGRFPRADRVQDLDKRYRWDLYWFAQHHNKDVWPDFYEYCNDTHIDTALRNIVAPLASNN